MRTMLIFVLLCSPVFGGIESLLAIESFYLDENGTGILIGQVESARSGKWEYDDPSWSASNTVPAGVYGPSGSGQDPPHTLFYLGTYNDPELDNHAIQVAGLMIGAEGNYQGVAPMAQLHSLSPDQTEEDYTIVVGINRLATMQSGQVQSINMSFGIDLEGLESPDGNSHLTKFIDWSARQHDVLYVVARGNADDTAASEPSDNYNGITVGASETVDSDTAHYSVNINYPDGDAEGERTSIDVLAPGAYVRSLGRSDSTTPQGLFGTSFATALTTGASALLQQRARDQLNLGNPDFVFGSRHEVMKAVMLNSADKLENVHGSRRTILNGPVLPQ